MQCVKYVNNERCKNYQTARSMCSNCLTAEEKALIVNNAVFAQLKKRLNIQVR